MKLTSRTALAQFWTILLVLSSSLAMSQSPSIVPQPGSIKSLEGKFEFTEHTKIVAPSEALDVAEQIRAALAPATGYRFEIVRGGSGSVIELKLGAKDLGDEGYRLKARGSRIVIEASKPAGLFYGFQTLRQLLPIEIYRRSKVVGVDWSGPSVEIEDQPRFKWRGAMLDLARHFQPKEFVLKFIDLMVMHKLNSLHMHLTDDQGWRMEIKRYPKLTEVGAWRKDTMLTYSPATYTGKPHGGYYTQEDLKEIVAYAAERFINVVPEIEMPGHAQAAIAAYPELGNNPAEQLEVFTKWGVNENVFNVKDSTIEFLQNVLAEVIEIFPSKFIHIGGDECPKSQWKSSAYAQEKMKRLGIKDEHELQSWFIKQMDQWLDAKGRRLVGWSEILEGGLAEGAALMVWLGNEGAMTAVSSGHDVIMAQTTHTYFDYFQSRDRAREPHAIGGFLPLEQAYKYNPVLPQMSPEQAKHVMGTQFQLWSEYIHNPKHVEYMAFPRGCALAEVAWSAVERKDYKNFLERLDIHLKRLSILDVNYRKLDPPGPQPTATWKSGEIGEEWLIKEWDTSASMHHPGEYEVRFQFTGGAHRLDIEWVELFEGSKLLSRVEQVGRTGGEDRNNVYRLDLTSKAVGTRVKLRARVRCDGGSDSNGEIHIFRLGAEEESA